MLRSLKNIYHLGQAVLASGINGFPGYKLRAIGVTGTDGKTTTVGLIYWILLQSGRKVGKVTTVDSEINGRKYSTSLHTTTPDSFKLQKLLRDCVDQGCEYVILEVSSHGIDQNRIWGIPFEIGVLTNITENEHLDYHGTFENYKNIKLQFIGSCKFQVTDTNSKYDIKYKSKLFGKFNEENIARATAVCRLLNVPEEKIRSGVESFSAPPGRLELVQDKPFKVIVDFAHTPGAFEKILPVAASMKQSAVRNKLIHVFGATGDRDKSKRPIMAEIASKYDDFIILTHEDTYSEDPKEIINALESGLRDKAYKSYKTYMDRKEAIKEALMMANPGDVVLLTGVGHQKTMNVGGKEIPWEEAKIVREILDDSQK